MTVRSKTRFRFRNAAALVILILAMGVVAYGLKRHPQHNPWAPLRLNQPVGWSTQDKLVALSQNNATCFAVLDAGGVGYVRRPTKGQGQCFANNLVRLNRTGPKQAAFAPVPPEPSCTVNISMILWERHAVQPAAIHHLGQRVIKIEHLGTYNCRTISGSSIPSEHANGNAIDISAFILADGQRVTLIDHWDARDGRSAFLKSVRDQSCDVFATVLSPDYNVAHANHFHFDQADRTGGWGVCR